MTATTAEPKYITPKILAAEWGCDIEAVLRLIHAGELFAIDITVKRGKPRWRIPREAIQDFAARRSIRPLTEPRKPRKRRLAETTGVKVYPE